MSKPIQLTVFWSDGSTRSVSGKEAIEAFQWLESLTSWVERHPQPKVDSFHWKKTPPTKTKKRVSSSVSSQISSGE